MRRLPAIASLALALLTAACSAHEPILAGDDGVSAASNDTVIYVVRRAWHTDISLPVEDLTLPLATLAQSVPGVRYLSFGFGERQFLLNRENTFGTMLRALLPSQSAVLVTFLKAPPDKAFGLGNVVTLRMTRANRHNIEAAIWQEFDKSSANEPSKLADGPYPGSSFYAARSTYHAFYTCNSWIAAILRVGGISVPVGVLFSAQIMDTVRWVAASQAPVSGSTISSSAEAWR